MHFHISRMLLYGGKLASVRCKYKQQQLKEVFISVHVNKYLSS